MYSVMIVDDEITIREKLPQIINFKQHGFEVCQSAKNGKEALELALLNRPNLIMLDVRMPVMDGLSFLKKLNEDNPDYFKDVYVIILSGYSDFEYAKEAIRYGAKAYLTKPVDEEEAAECIGSIKVELDKRAADKTRNVYRTDYTALRKAYNEYVDISLQEEYFMLHIVPKSIKTSHEKEQLGHTICNAIAQENGFGADMLFVKTAFVYSFFVPARCKFSVTDLQQKLKAKTIDCAFLCDVQMPKNISDFRNTFTEHLGLMLKANFYDGENIIFYSSNMETQWAEKEEAAYINELECIYGHMQCALEALNECEAKAEMEKLFKLIEKEKLSIERIEQISSRLYYLQTGLFASMREDKQTQKPAISKLEWQDNAVFIDFEEWKELQSGQLADVFEFLHRRKEMQKMGVGGELLEYIHANYRNAISIKQVAEEFHMNPAYLGRVFQKAAGVSFKQYVNDLRIKEAKRLLRNSDMLIYEIAEDIGFSDSSYFVAKFTKEEGMSPAEYREH